MEARKRTEQKRGRRRGNLWLQEQGMAKVRGTTGGGATTLTDKGRDFLILHIWHTLGRPGFPDEGGK